MRTTGLSLTTYYSVHTFILPYRLYNIHVCNQNKMFFYADLTVKIAEMFCPFSSGRPSAAGPPKANTTQTEQQRPLNLKHLSEAVRTLTSPPVSTY